MHYKILLIKKVICKKARALKAAAELAQRTFAASKEYIEGESFYDRMDTGEQLAAWQRMSRQYVVGAEQRMATERKVVA